MYGLNFAINPPEGDWAVEVFITGPNGESVASFGLIEGANPEVGETPYKICRVTTSSGVFSVQAKLSVQNGPGQQNYTEGQLPPTTFTLEAAKKRKKQQRMVYPQGR